MKPAIADTDGRELQALSPQREAPLGGDAGSDGGTSIEKAAQGPPSARKVLSSALHRHHRHHHRHPSLYTSGGGVSHTVVAFVGEAIRILISPLSAARQFVLVRDLCVAWRATPVPSAAVSSSTVSGADDGGGSGLSAGGGKRGSLSPGDKGSTTNSASVTTAGGDGIDDATSLDAYIESLARRCAPVVARKWTRGEAEAVISAAFIAAGPPRGQIVIPWA
jgi:hypothetical protein